MEPHPNEKWALDHGINGAGFNGYVNLDCQVFALTEYRKKISQWTKEAEANRQSITEAQKRLRVFEQQAAQLRSEGFGDRDRPLRTVLGRIEATKEAIRISETTIAGNIQNQVSFYQKLAAETEQRVNNLRAKAKAVLVK